MHVILGGTGHVGSAAASALLRQGEKVIVVTRHRSNAAHLAAQGAEVAVADVRDVVGLRKILARGRRAFLLNPPADPATDTDAEERTTVAAIAAAIEGLGLEKLVAESAYGAHAGEAAGDLTVLHGLEQRLQAQSIPASINRAAYYMSNWDSALETARRDGVINSFFPADFKIPMVAPQDLGEAAARRLLEPAETTGIFHVEGPQRYSAADVASAFGRALGKTVLVAEVPRDRWVETYAKLGFSDAAARSYARMTEVTLDNPAEPENPERGRIGLHDYIGALCTAKRSV